MLQLPQAQAGEDANDLLTQLSLLVEALRTLRKALS